MKSIFSIITICLIISNSLYSQDKGLVYGLSFSQTDFQSADFFSMQPKNGELEVLSIAKGMGLFSVGASAIDDWTREYLVWGQTAGYASSGFVFDQKTGKLIQTIKSDLAPIDLKYDSRLHKYYGLCYNDNRKGVSIIQISGNNVKKLWVLEDIKSISVRTTAFDANRGLYIFLGRNKKGETRLYRVNMNDGVILDQPLVDDYLFTAFQYDLQDNRLYALARKKTNVTQYFFVEINLLNAYPTIIRPLIDLKMPVLGLSTFNQKKGSYMFVGENKKGETHFYEMDVFEGSFYSKVLLNETFSELHFDNSIFISEFFKNIVFEDKQSFSQSNSYSKNGDSFHLFDKIYVDKEIKLDDIEYIKDETIEAIVLDKWNKVVRYQKVFLRDNSIENSVLVKDLPQGIYVLRLKTGKRTYSQRFLKN